jgi:recombination protein RecA
MDERIGQGRENAKKFLADHPEMFADIEKKVRLGYGLPAETLVKAEGQEQP